MSRNIKDLHPELQSKWNRLLSLCASNGISIKNSECVRTVAEQDALYAQGRTKPGKIITNPRGTSYSSQHQWGIAVDFYLDMDVDGDGSKSDDAFNNSTALFKRVGILAKSIGLAWGGDWTKPVDMPHLYLPQWGKTPSELKKIYGTPDKFMKTWTTNVPSTKSYLSKGDNGEDVKLMQIMLNACGYNCGKADGIFGKNTYTAVIAFQKANGLVVDGLYGKLSKAKLTSIYNTPTNTTKYTVGQTVTYSACYISSSNGADKVIKCNPAKSGKITKILTGARNPYLIENGRCWVNEADIKGVSTGNQTTAKPSTPAPTTPKFNIGKNYTLQDEMKVRTGAGTDYRAKKYEELTSSGRKHDKDGDGALDKGTVVTCKEVKNVGNDIWIRTPSGWIAAKYNGKVYVNKEGMVLYE